MAAAVSPAITLLTADSLAIDPASISECGVMITDPPYSAFVHANATSKNAGEGAHKRDLGFESLSVAARRKTAAFAAAVKRWSIVYSDIESVSWLSISAHAAGAQYVRTMPWVRWSMPNLTGTMPPQGFEALVVLHRADRKPRSRVLRRRGKRWNGPGNLTHFSEARISGANGEDKYSAEKPLDQALRLVSWFSEPDEIVFDPFAGVGTVGQACRLLGRGYVGVEILEGVAAQARTRLSGALSPRDEERVARFLAADDEPASKAKEGPSLWRASMRANDKAHCARIAAEIRAAAIADAARAA